MLGIPLGRPADAHPSPVIRTRLARRLATAALAWLLALSWLAPVHADMYKCRGADGRTTYGDAPCPSGGAAWKPRANVTVVPSSSLTGRRAGADKSESLDGSSQSLKPIDPIGDCKRRGGRIDRELRACMVP